MWFLGCVPCDAPRGLCPTALLPVALVSWCPTFTAVRTVNVFEAKIGKSLTSVLIGFLLPNEQQTKILVFSSQGRVWGPTAFPSRPGERPLTAIAPGREPTGIGLAALTAADSWPCLPGTHAAVQDDAECREERLRETNPRINISVSSNLRSVGSPYPCNALTQLPAYKSVLEHYSCCGWTTFHS